MNPESDLLRLRDPNVLANRFGTLGPNDELVRLPSIRFEPAPNGSALARTLRCVTPAHVLTFALVLGLLALIERIAHPLHLS